MDSLHLLSSLYLRTRKLNGYNMIQPIDSFKHKGLRKQLVELLRKEGIQDENVLNAINAVPRHFFMDSSFDELAYQNKAFPIACGQTISHPYTVARQTELLNVQPMDKILEIGTGSGYQCSILCQMKAKVFTIERFQDLYLKAKGVLTLLKFRPKMFCRDGFEGLPAFAPFDKIIVTCGAGNIPQKLVRQLKIGGFMIIPVGTEQEQTMYKITRVSEDEIATQTFGNYRFVPMLKERVTHRTLF